MNKISDLAFSLYTFSLDFVFTILNLVTPNKAVGSVVPRGHPGEGGKWPEYIPPKEGDSRCACPALNAMANHGILSRDGKNISFVEMNHKIRATFNFASTFCAFVPNTMAKLLNRPYSTGTLDLAEINLHNGIEHDASLTREDTAIAADQGPPSIPLCKALLESATGRDSDGSPLLTISDVARFSAKRRREARQTNKDFTLAHKHKIFGSTNASTLLVTFGGKVKDLTPFLLEERLPDGWQSRFRGRFGLTFATFNITIFRLEHRTKKAASSADTAVAPNTQTDPPAADPSPSQV